jgi:hypothetical protein
MSLRPFCGLESERSYPALTLSRRQSPALANPVQRYLAGAELTNVRLRHPYWAVCDFRRLPDDAKMEQIV